MIYKASLLDTTLLTVLLLCFVGKRSNSAIICNWARSVLFKRVMIRWTLYVCMKSVFILAYLATICWLMWIIQSPTSSLFPAPCLVLERDLSCSTSLSYRPVSSFIQLYLYRLLAATNSGSLLPFWLYVDLTLPDRTHLVGSLLAIVLSIFIAFRRFFVGCGLRDRFQPLPSHRFCGFGLKHRRGLFGANMVAWWLPWGDCGSHWCGSFFRLTYCAEATDSP